MTGADGFVGRETCQALLSAGFKVRASVRSRRENAATPNRYDLFESGDIGNDTDWTDALKGIDCAVHLAARVHIVIRYNKNPLEEFRRVNGVGTERLAGAAAEAGASCFVFLSTIKVNGEGTRFCGNVPFTPYTENDVPSSEAPYAVSE